MAALTAEFLAPRLRGALAEVARRLSHGDIPFVVGGSTMLAARGLEVTVGDLDICTTGDRLDAVLTALESLNPVVLWEPPPPWRSTWLVRAVFPGDDTAVDVIGDLAIDVDGEVARFPVDVDHADVVDVESVAVPFDSMWRWYHLYVVHNPARAAQIAAIAGPGDLENAAAELGL